VRRAVIALVAALALAAPAAAGAADSVQIRHVDAGDFPLVRVTAVAPVGSRPTLFESGRSARDLKVRDLGSAGAMVLAVDNSDSMSGAPLRQAKAAASQFFAGQQRVRATGLVSFAHEALALTGGDAEKEDVADALASLATDLRTGTALYDAVKLSAARLEGLSDSARILVLLTDGRDLGSRSTLADAIAAVQQANVVVYAIAAGPRADRRPLEALASGSGGRLLAANDASGLASAYVAVGRELARTWHLSYLTRAVPGERRTITIRAAGTSSSAPLVVPKQTSGGLRIPGWIAESPLTALGVVLLTALLLAGAGAVGIRRHRGSEISRLLKPHVRSREALEETDGPTPFAGLLAWTERSLADLPGSERLLRLVERSGISLRVGHLPYLASAGALVLGAVGSFLGAPPVASLALMLLGLASPILALRVAAHRRTKAFDRQLPDVLATIASTLRAGHGLRPALRAIADDGTPPASEEFRRVLGEERLGLPLDQAIDAMCVRIGSPDLEYVATAINVQAQTGGSLADLFTTLSETVRERQRHARKVRALTAMGRMSAIVLVGMPIALAGLMTVLSPTYMAPLYSTSGGHAVIVGCLISMAIGSLFLKRIVSVRY